MASSRLGAPIMASGSVPGGTAGGRNGFFVVSVALLLFVCGGSIMALEILASRLMAPFFGSSIYVWGSIISSIMVHLTFGYVLGGHLAKKGTGCLSYACILFLASGFIFFIPNLNQAAAGWLSDRIAEVRLGSMLAMNLVFLVPMTLMATVTPYAIGLMERVVPGHRLGPGAVLAISTAGSFLGTNLTSFYLIGAIRVSRIVYGIGFCCALSVGVFLVGAAILSKPRRAEQPELGQPLTAEEQG